MTAPEIDVPRLEQFESALLAGNAVRVGGHRTRRAARHGAEAERARRHRLAGAEYRTSRAGEPAQAVSGQRLGRLRRALADYASRHRQASSGLRIDLVALTPAGDAWRLAHWPGVDAW